MKYKRLTELLSNKSGAFICAEIDKPKKKKTIPIQHKADRGLGEAEIEKFEAEVGHIPGLVDFYQIYTNVELFQDPVSGDTAYYIASPENWFSLRRDFETWIKDLDQEDADLIPSWVENSCVIGERPGTGNYFLLATDGQCTGCVFEFEHDGFEFDLLAESFPAFIEHLVEIDENKLLVIASALRFVVQDTVSKQWYIEEYKDNSRSIPLERKGLGYRLKVFFTQGKVPTKSNSKEVANFNLPAPDSHGCSTIEHTELILPNDEIIVLCCEMNKFGSSLHVSEPGEHEFNGARIGGKSWFSVRGEKGFSVSYTVDDSTKMFFELSE